VPKNIDRSRRHAALVIGGPYGAVKEQASGLHAQTMAERGFITIAHDPSYVGESAVSEPKELFIVPGAGHVDLYDRVNLIPWDKLTSFFATR
jgi:fermentation-respiration switch protein FrsA (DUF1100 family)